MMQYALIDSILDDVQKVFKDIKVKYDLPNATIERWRWDIPQISLCWKGDDAIWRNMNVLLLPDRDSQDHPHAQIEVNAWQDVRKDNRWIRRWRHEVMAEGIFLNIIHKLRTSYETVDHWTVENLTHQEPLSEAASSILDQQRRS